MQLSYTLLCTVYADNWLQFNWDPCQLAKIISNLTCSIQVEIFFFFFFFLGRWLTSK